MRQVWLCLMLVLSVPLFSATSLASVEVFVVYDVKDQHFRIQTEKISYYAAHARFNNTIEQNGWSFLDIKTDGQHTDDIQAYAAGLAEGYLTQRLISDHWHNTAEGYCTSPPSPYCQRLRNFLHQNLLWMKEQVETNPNSPYWHQVRLFLIQLNAMIDGYNNASGPPSIDIEDPLGLLYLQIQDDVYDLENVLRKENLHHVLGAGKCSALIKLLPGNGNLLVAHDTWSSYSTMLRILKKYNFSFHLTENSG